jgi:hypothetical protein
MILGVDSSHVDRFLGTYRDQRLGFDPGFSIRFGVWTVPTWSSAQKRDKCTQKAREETRQQHLSNQPRAQRAELQERQKGRLTKPPLRQHPFPDSPRGETDTPPTRSMTCCGTSCTCALNWPACGERSTPCSDRHVALGCYKFPKVNANYIQYVKSL